MRLGLLIRMTAFLIITLTVGIGSARWLIARSAGAVPISAGAWKIWTDDGAGVSGPYGAAHYLLSGRLPPAANQVKVYETDQDDDGNPLDADCIYTVTGPAQGARWWEITLIDPLSGPIFDSDAPMSGISSAQIIGNADGSFTITVAREPKPGNWISPGALTRYALTVSLRFARFHDTIEPAEVLPRITRGECS
jgi:hypothetical protein